MPKNKKFFKSKKNHHNDLTSGKKGFICTCNYQESNCIKEALNLLNEYTDSTDEAIKNESSSENEEDISDIVSKEAKRARIDKKKFQVLNSGVNNCVFISSNLDEDPVTIAHNILKDAKSTQKLRARYLLRLLPVSATCNANTTDITKTVDKYLNDHFSQGNKTFAVVYKCRNNSSLKRDDIIKLIADKIKLKNITNNADLANPQLVVLVEILHKICCISVVPDYFYLSKYNIHEASKVIVKTETKINEVKPDKIEEVTTNDDKTLQT